VHGEASERRGHHTNNTNHEPCYFIFMRARVCAVFSSFLTHHIYMYARLKLTHDVADQDQGMEVHRRAANCQIAHGTYTCGGAFPINTRSSSPCAPPRTHSLQYNFGLCTTTFAARCHLRSVPNFVTFWKPPRFPI